MDFRAFERTGWEHSQVCQRHDATISTVTTRRVEPLLAAGGAKAGIRLLAVASGAGYVAQRVRQTGVSAVGYEISMPAVIASGVML